jgi:uncharacterized protein YciI
VFFVAICLDKPDSHELRLQNRAAHLDYLRLNSDAIKTCGPFLSEDNKQMIGSLLVIEADNRRAAETLLARDPYRIADLFQSVEVRPWRWVIGAPVK